MDGDDVRMGQCRRGSCLLLESAARLIVCERRRKNLQRDVTAQTDVACPIHFAHAAGGDVCQDLIRTETGAGCEHGE
jgi:hypothetical protein